MDTTLDRRGKDGVDEIIAIKVDVSIDIDIDIRIDKEFSGTEANRTASPAKSRKSGQDRSGIIGG